MENRIDTSDHESIGALLRRLRLERSLEISDVAAETRITPGIIRAMEADDFTALPAMAFARGFYGLYAAMLGLNQEEVVQRFLEEYHRADSVPKIGGLETPRWQERHVGSMASPPSHSLGTIIGIGLLILLLIAAGASWYAGYNPASQASKWLRGFQKNPEEQSIPENQTIPEWSTPESQINPPERFDTPAESSAPPQTRAPVEEGYRYLFVAEFQQAAAITINVDDESAETVQLPGGTIKTWQARDSIAVELPENAAVRLFLNGITLPLPPATNGKIAFTIPEYLLD